MSLPDTHTALQNGKTAAAPSVLLDKLLLAAALAILFLSANQLSYAPKQGIHTIVHVAPADALISLVALLIALPYLEQARWGRVISWVILAVEGAAVVALSNKGHDFMSVVHHGGGSAHLKSAAASAVLLILMVWQVVRLFRSGGQEIPMPALPAPVWALFVVALLSAITMILPSESLHDWLHTPESKDAIRKGVLFLVELFQQLGIALFVFLAVLRTPGRTRLAVRALLFGVFICMLVALPQYVHFALHPAELTPQQLAARSMTTDHTGPLVEGLMQSRKAYGGLLCLALPLALGCLLGSRRRIIRIGYAAFIGLALITTLSGAAFWCALIGLAVTGLCARTREARVFALGCILFGLLIAAALPWNRSHVVREFFTIHTAPAPGLATPGATTAAPASRVLKKEYVEWIAGVYMTGEHFWLGVGPGQYQLNIGQYYGEDPNPAVRLERDSNNLYLVYAASIGFAGLIALLQLILSAVRRSWTASRQAPAANAHGASSTLAEWWRSCEGSALSAGGCGALAAFLIINLFTSLLIRGVGVVFAFLIALAWISSRGAVSQSSSKGSSQ